MEHIKVDSEVSIDSKSILSDRSSPLDEMERFWVAIKRED